MKSEGGRSRRGLTAGALWCGRRCQGGWKMIDLQSFQRIAEAQAASPGAVLVLQPGGQDVTARSGFFARWSGHVRLVENYRATGRFIQAVSEGHGAEIAGEMARSCGMTGALGRARPLTVRNATQALRHAHDRRSVVDQRNEILAECVARVEPHDHSTESVRIAIAQEIASRFSGQSGLMDRIDVNRVAAAVKQSIVEAGGEGTHLIGFREARATRRNVIEHEVAFASLVYSNARAVALIELNPRERGSLVSRLLRDGFARFIPPLDYEEHTLTLDAAEQLHQRFEDAIATGRIPATRLAHHDDLVALAREEVGRFLEERRAARSAIAEHNYLPEAMKLAMLAAVSRDSIPADLARRAAETGFAIGEDLASLVEPLETEDLENMVENLRLATVTSFTQPDAGARETNEEREYRWLWRILLASVSDSQALAILRQLAPNGHLRGIGEGARWYAEEFGENAEHLRAARSANDLRSFKSTAGDLANMLDGLWVILGERTGWVAVGGRRMAANSCPDDQAVASLRNLGIPFPAPGRLGEENPDVPISRPTLEEINEALEDHVRSNGRIHRSGLSRNCMNFLRSNESIRIERFKARFFIDGRELPRKADAKTVARALVEFCTNGDLDKNMLANVSRLFDHATLDCVYAGCMNPKRPDLAMMDGYPEGVYEGHSYSLWKDDDGRVLLGIAEMITPLFLHRAQPAGTDAGEGRAVGDKPHDAPVVLSAHKSNFSTRAVVEFDPESCKPEFAELKIGYSLIPGGPERPYWIPKPEARAADKASAYRSESDSDGSNESVSVYEPLL